MFAGFSENDFGSVRRFSVKNEVRYAGTWDGARQALHPLANFFVIPFPPLEMSNHFNDFSVGHTLIVEGGFENFLVIPGRHDDDVVQIINVATVLDWLRVMEFIADFSAHLLARMGNRRIPGLHSCDILKREV